MAETHAASGAGSAAETTQDFCLCDHTVARGETLPSIAQSYGLTVMALVLANPDLTNGSKYKLAPGRTLCISSGAGSMDTRALERCASKFAAEAPIPGTLDVPVARETPAATKSGLKRFNVGERVKVTFTETEKRADHSDPVYTTYEKVVGVVTNAVPNAAGVYVYTVRFEGQEVGYHKRDDFHEWGSGTKITEDDDLVTAFLKLGGGNPMRIRAGYTREFTGQEATILPALNLE